MYIHFILQNEEKSSELTCIFFFRYLKAFLEQEMFLLYRNRNDFIEGPSMILLKDLLTMCLSTLGLQAPQEYRSFPIYYRSFNSCYCDSLYSIL